MSEFEEGGAEPLETETGEQVEVTAETTTAEGEDAPNEADDEREAKRKKGAEKRIHELHRKSREAEALAEQRAQELEALRKELEAAKAGKSREGAPKEDDFETYADYLEAKTEWIAEQKLNEIERKRAEKDAERREQQELAAKRARADSVEEEGREKFKDFEDVVLGGFVQEFAPDRGFIDEILESDSAADILYYLGKNQAVAADMMAKTGRARSRALWDIEQRFKSKAISNAPAPARTVTGNGGRVTSNKPPSDPGEYRKWLARQK